MCTIPTNDLFIKIKLPPLLLQAFFIDHHQVKCKKCDFTCTPNGKDILFHLMICNGLLLAEKIKTKFNFNCLMCNYTTNNIHMWKTHLFRFNHISKGFDSHETKYSFHCESCNTQFYGFKDNILKHECKPKSLSIISELMAYASKNFNIEYKHMLYFCSDCEQYSYNITELHTKEHCKALTNSSTYICESCHITFYGFCEKTFLNHQVSFEHMIFWCLNTDRKNSMRSTASQFNKLPMFITKYYEINNLSRQSRCIICSKISLSSYDFIYGHFVPCISSKEMSDIDKSTPLNTVNCEICNYKHSTKDKNMYTDWVKHVISFDHLRKKTALIIKNKKKLYSYYCSEKKTIFYGTEKFISKQFLLKNSETKRSLFVSKVMAEAYAHSSTNLNCTVLFCCGFCESFMVDQSKKSCIHVNTDSSLLFYCSTCLVKFNLKIDYNEHILSSEHIVLKYFKPNQSSELKNLEHSLKMRLSYFSKSNDDKNGYYSLSDHNNDEKKVFESVNSDEIEIQSKLTGSHSLSHTSSEENMEIECESSEQHKRKCSELSNQISSMSCAPKVDSVLNFILRLSAQPQKTALNIYLRMKFEFLNQVPHAINIFYESKSFFCSICDFILCDPCGWTKHYTKCHDKINNPIVFYCTICFIYHISNSISTSISISDHIQTTEHSVMLEFHELVKNNTIEPIVHDEVSPTLSANDQVCDEENECKIDQYSKETKKNPNIFIEIKDIDAHLKRNNYSPLKIIIEKKYGKFTQISNKSYSFIILFDKMNQVDDFINDKEELEKQYGFNIHILGQDIILNIKVLFSDWKLFRRVIFSQLQSMKSNGGGKINTLCDSVRDLYNGSESIDVHVFGSRLYELATENSDIDLYLDIGGTFYGDIADNIDKQIDLVKTFAQQCFLKCEEFKNVEEICDARVPILKFFHIPTQINCDISFRSGLSLYKSKLIKLYLSIHDDVKWLVCAVKYWALKNNLIDKTLFTSYALVWLVLFYLMTKKIIPPLAKLVKNATKDDHKIIEGWDCTFGKYSVSFKAPDRQKLLLGFFQYYSEKRQFKNKVLSMFTGESINKQMFFKHFCKLPELSEIQREKFKTFQSKVNSSFVTYYGLAIHDPFELSFNITRNICSDNLKNFCMLCDQSETVLNTKKCSKESK